MPEAAGQNSAQSTPGRKLGNASGGGESNYVNESTDLSTSVDLFDAKQALREEGYEIPDHDNNPLGDSYFDESDDGSKKKKKSKQRETESNENEEVEDEEGGEDASDDEDEGEDSEDGDEEADSEDDDRPSVKTLKVDIDGKEINVPVDTEIPTKVDGKVKNVSISDLQNAYASKAKRSSELEKIKEERASIVTERRKAASELQKREVALASKEHSLKTEAEAVKGLKIETIINEACFRAGVSAADFWDRADDILGLYYGGDGTEENPGYNNLTKAQQAAIRANRRVNLNDAHHSRIDTERKQKEALTSFESFKSSMLERSGLTIDDAETAWEELDKSAQQGKLDKKTIEEIKAMTAEQKFQLACAQALANRTFNRVSSVISESFPKLTKQVEKIVKDLEDTVGTNLLMKANNKQLARLVKTWQGDVNSDSDEDESFDDSDDDSESKKRSATTKLGDKASPRHKRSKAATQNNRNEDDPYSQDAASPQNVVFGAAFKTFA